MARTYMDILDGSVSIDINSEKAFKFKRLCEEGNHPMDVIISVYGSFDDMYKSGDIRVNFHKVFNNQNDKE